MNAKPNSKSKPYFWKEKLATEYAPITKCLLKVWYTCIYGNIVTYASVPKNGKHFVCQLFGTYAYVGIYPHSNMPIFEYMTLQFSIFHFGNIVFRPYKLISIIFNTDYPKQVLVLFLKEVSLCMSPINKGVIDVFIQY